ncbi:unnamed protein product [Ambrosiozyma monospora]|uniref:Unnamed protein product n=1 Tax=Ambrosiozyma monospora TaxID=43982 RepID=A0ACB5U5U8_AMBMO|nr:unnamed protein product [Ambrosiozyma monospora]
MDPSPQQQQQQQQSGSSSTSQHQQLQLSISAHSTSSPSPESHQSSSPFCSPTPPTPSPPQAQHTQQPANTEYAEPDKMSIEQLQRNSYLHYFKMTRKTPFTTDNTKLDMAKVFSAEPKFVARKITRLRMKMGQFTDTQEALRQDPILCQCESANLTIEYLSTSCSIHTKRQTHGSSYTHLCFNKDVLEKFAEILRERGPIPT